jgi:hypothetical protein
MAFITDSGSVISFAEYTDVTAQDKRLFDSNEGLTDDVVEDALIKATDRILNRISASGWWRNYYMKRESVNSVADIPSVNADQILGRQSDFTELCVATALAEYILPQVADFGDDTNSERAKMGYYQNRAVNLFEELIRAGDWYDFDDDSTVESTEKELGYVNLRRRR